MKTTNTKKVTEYKVLVTIYSVALIIMGGVTLYGYFFSPTHESVFSPAILAAFTSGYCCIVAAYEDQKKKAKRQAEAKIEMA